MCRYRAATVLITAIVCAVSAVQIASSQIRSKLVEAKDGSGIIGYKDTPILPWCGYHVHDPDRPAPPKVTPGLLGIDEKAGTAPSGAVKLFNGTDLSKWKPSDWKSENGELIAVSGELTTKQSFGDCQLHLEWQAPLL